MHGTLCIDYIADHKTMVAGKTSKVPTDVDFALTQNMGLRSPAFRKPKEKLRRQAHQAKRHEQEAIQQMIETLRTPTSCMIDVLRSLQTHVSR